MKKDVMYLPKISPEDFEVFRNILKDEIGANFQEWLERRRERIAMYDSDNVIIEVRVRADEFSSFCHAKCLACDGNSLLRFAEIRGKADA